MWITDTPTSERFPIFTRANADEVGPEPFTPLTWTLAWELGALPGTADGWANLGAFRPEEFRSPVPEVFGCWGGYFYNQVSVGRVFGVRAPGAGPDDIDRTYFGSRPDVPPYVPREEDEDADLSAAVGERLGAAMAAERLDFVDDFIAESRRWIAERPQLSDVDHAGLVEHARASARRLREAWEVYLQVIITASVAPGLVHAIAGQVGHPEDAVAAFAAIGDVVSAHVNEELWALSRQVRASERLTGVFDDGVTFEQLVERAEDSSELTDFIDALHAFIDRHGHRGPFEYELSSPTWATDPDIVVTMIGQLRRQSDEQSPTARIEAQAVARRDAVERIVQALESDPQTQAVATAAIASGQLHYRMREASKDALLRVNDEIRRPLRVLAERLHGQGLIDRADDLFSLREDELDSFLADPSGWRETLGRRSAELQDLARRIPPYVVDHQAGVPDPSTWPLRSEDLHDAAPVGSTLSGIGVSPGTFTGRARVVSGLAEAEELEPDEVLICATTDPSWTPLFMSAGAVVCEIGAEGSHAAIVARELGIPGVMSVRDVLSRVRPGDTVTVDGSRGTLIVEKRLEPEDQ